jgi:hypothetical protein
MYEIPQGYGEIQANLRVLEFITTCLSGDRLALTNCEAFASILFGLVTFSASHSRRVVDRKLTALNVMKSVSNFSADGENQKVN